MPSVALQWTDPTTGEPQQRILPLPVTLGRAADNTLVLDSAVVSGHHATLRLEPHGILLEDLASRNGVFVQGQRVQTAVMEPGSVIGIGPFELVVRLETADVRVRIDWVEGVTGVVRRAVLRLPVHLGSDPSCGVVVPGAAPRQITVYGEQAHEVHVVDETGARSIAIDGTWVDHGMLRAGAAVQLGATRYVITLDSAARRRSAGESTIVLSDGGVLAAVAAQIDGQGPPWPPPAFERPHVSLAELASLGLPIGTTDYCTVGAGLGSFIWVDNLVVRGVQPEQIVALGVDPVPYGRYQRLCRNSQIPDHERLRSNSESTPDNPWGWPGYASREIARDLARGHFVQAVRTLWQIVAEPALAETYTPVAADVFRGLDREAARIGWSRIVRYGRVRAIRKTDDGRYVIAFSQKAERGSSRAFLVARHLQIATGYPALQFLPDLQKYREETGDFTSVVNAYEDHDRVYAHLQQHGGRVLLRGRGIVASRILQRIDEVRAINPRVTVVHLNRSPLLNGHQWRHAQRTVRHHFELQPFNWPKACWGGDLRPLLERASPDERKRLLTDWGGTTTADRNDWVRMLDRGLREGWYQVVFGEVEQVSRTEGGLVATQIRGRGVANETRSIETEFIIDATGLDARARTNPLLRDLIDHYALPLNPLNRLDVSPSFEVEGLRNGRGRAFAAGAMTLGGPFAPVDSFLGLQYNASVSIDALVDAKAPGARSLAPWRSVSQWLKWAMGSPP